jgi:GntR family transcriptional regulator
MRSAPRYLELAVELRQAIAFGDLGPAGALESEAALGRRFGVSRVTVRKALKELEREGLIFSRPGSGWYAVAPVENALGLFPTEVLAHEAAGGEIARTALDARWLEAPNPIATTLELNRGEKAFRFRRVNSADGMPYDLVTTWLPPDVAQRTDAAELEQTGAWAVLVRLGLVPVRTEQTITGALATRDEARALGAASPLALLLLRRVGYLVNGRAVAVSDHRYPGTRIRFSATFAGLHPPVAPPLISAGSRATSG